MKKVIKPFDKVHSHYDRFMKFFKLYREKEIENILKLKGDETILDIGGGTGYLANYFVSKCHEVLVLDESEKMLSHVKTKKGITILNESTLNTNIKNEKIDVIILSDVFHHIKEQKELINECYRVLKNDGKILIHDFNINHMKTKVLRLFENILFGKLYFKNVSEVKSIINSKFNLISIKESGNYFMILGEKNDKKI